MHLLRQIYVDNLFSGLFQASFCQNDMKTWQRCFFALLMQIALDFLPKWT